MTTRRDALLFVCPWLTESEADGVLAGEDDQGPTILERLAHAEREHREWMHFAIGVWREATGSEAPWPGTAKARAEVKASRAARAESEGTHTGIFCGCGDEIRADDARCGNCYAGRHRVDCWCHGCVTVGGPPSVLADAALLLRQSDPQIATGLDQLIREWPRAESEGTHGICGCFSEGINEGTGGGA